MDGERNGVGRGCCHLSTMMGQKVMADLIPGKFRASKIRKVITGIHLMMAPCRQAWSVVCVTLYYCCTDRPSNGADSGHDLLAKRPT